VNIGRELVKSRWMVLVALCGLAGCGTLSPGSERAGRALTAVVNLPHAVVQDSGMQGDCALAVQLDQATFSGFRSQAVVHAWGPADIYQYEVTLRTLDTTSGHYEDFDPPLTAIVPMKGQDNPYNRAVFTHLRQGFRYRAEIVAKGNVGGTAAEQVLNSVTGTAVDYDFSAAQDVEDTLYQRVKVILDPAAFQGTANLILVTPDPAS